MEITNYPDFVAARIKPGATLISGLTPDSMNALHMAVGVAGEAGELLDAIKKFAVYCKPADLVNIREELGDLEFYMEGLRQQFGLTREEVLMANVEKLQKRYATKYSDAQAVARADKPAGE